MGWKPELTDGSGWGRNALVFDTEQEAHDSARETFNRWLAAKEYRAVEVDEPATHYWDEERGNVRKGE